MNDDFKEKVATIRQKLMLMKAESEQLVRSNTLNQHQALDQAISVANLDNLLKTYKDQIEDAYESVKKEFIDAKERFTKILLSDRPDRKTIDKFESDLKNNNFNEAQFRRCLQAILKQIDIVKQFSSQFKFVVNETEITKYSIGYIYSDNNIPFFKQSEPEYKELRIQPKNIIQLSNGNVVIHTSDSNTLYLYDMSRNFLLLEKYKHEEDPEQPLMLTCDGKDNIFAIVGVEILVFDQNLRTKLGSRYNICDALYGACSIYDDNLYLSVMGAHRIITCKINLKTNNEQQVSTSPGVYPTNAYDLDYEPIDIKVLKNVACIFGDNRNINFYKLPMFQPISKYSESGILFIHTDMFYLCSNRHLFVFNLSGENISSKPTDLPDMKLWTSESIAIINGKLTICLKNKILFST